MANAGEEPGFQIDKSRWPIVIMKLSGVLSDEDFETMFAESEKIFARGKPHVALVDLRDLKAGANAAQRKVIAARTQEIEAAYPGMSLGNVMIVTSAVIRGALTAVEWLRQRKRRDTWVGSMDEALNVADRLLRKYECEGSPMSKGA